MNTKAYTLNGAVYTFDVETGALLSLEMDGVKPMMSEGKGLFDLAWPVHLEYDIQRANPTASYGKCAPSFEYDDGTLTITYDKVPYTMPCDDVAEYEGGISAVVTLKALEDGKSVSMRLNLKNNSKANIEQVLFPDVNGNLYLDLKSENIDAGIILSDRSFSYFTDDNDEKDIPFSLDIFMQVLRSINKIAA